MFMHVTCNSSFIKSFRRDQIRKEIVDKYIQFLFCFIKFSEKRNKIKKKIFSNLLLKIPFQTMSKLNFTNNITVFVFLPPLLSFLKHKKKSPLLDKAIFLCYFYNNFYHLKRHFVFWKFFIIIYKNASNKIIFTKRFLIFLYKLVLFSLRLSLSNTLLSHSFFFFKIYSFRTKTKLNITLIKKFVAKTISTNLKNNHQEKIKIIFRILIEVLINQNIKIRCTDKKKFKTWGKLKNIFRMNLTIKKRLNLNQLLKFLGILYTCSSNKIELNHLRSIFFFLMHKFLKSKIDFLSVIYKHFLKLIDHSLPLKDRMFISQVIFFTKPWQLTRSCFDFGKNENSGFFYILLFQKFLNNSEIKHFNFFFLKLSDFSNSRNFFEQIIIFQIKRYFKFIGVYLYFFHSLNSTFLILNSFFCASSCLIFRTYQQLSIFGS